MIKGLLGYSSLGIYAISNKIPQILTTFYSLFFKAWQISSIKELNKEDTEKFYSNILNMLMKFMFAICILMLIGINVIFFVLIGDEFKEAVYYVPVLILSTVFYALSSFMGTIYTAYKKSNDILNSTIMSATINIVINIIFMKKFGLITACMSTLISYIFLFIYRYYHSKKFMNVKINIKEIILYCVMISIMIFNIYMFGLSYKNIIFNIFIGFIYTVLNIKYVIKILNKEL